MIRRCLLTLLFGSLFATIACADPADRINELIADGYADAGVSPAERCSDGEFVRRAYLDLAGRIPLVAEVETFLANEQADRRVQLIYQLTDSEDYVQHFADTFDALLMGRGDRGKYDERAKHGWRDYLERVFRENRSWRDVAREIVLARPTNETDRGCDWFLFERKNEHQQIAEAVAPAVFGIRVECAQCHNHPMAAEILQAHYWGLVAFFNRSKNEQTENGPRVAESAIGGFSEFADLSGDSLPNFLTFFESETIEEPRPDKDTKQEDSDELYLTASVEHDPRIPKFSRREKFAEEVISEHPLIARAMVNRVWAMLMGRGLVHPFDKMDSVHEPSHKKLLDELAEDYESSGFDTRRLVRAIACSNPYQLDSRPPDGVDDPATFAWYLERPLIAEQLSRSIQLALRGQFRNDAPIVHQMRDHLVDVMPEENVTTMKDALFLTNNASLNEYIAQSDAVDDLPTRVGQLASTDEQVGVLFNVIFSRMPQPDESSAVADYLNPDTGSRDERLKQVIWSMLTSAEFRLNH